MKSKFFTLAKKISQKSDHRHQIGGVLVKKSKIISIGFNKMRTHTKSSNPYKSIHCEFDVILGCSKEDLKGSTLYIYREHKNGRAANCKPCQYCATLIKESGIKNVYYTDDNNYKEFIP